MKFLNYSRWNDLEVSDSEEEESGIESTSEDLEESPPPSTSEGGKRPPFVLASSLSSSLSRTPKTSPRRKVPLFVKLHPLDDGTGLVDGMFEHPDSYHKQISPSGDIESWGLFPYVPPGQEGAGHQDYGGMEKMMRKMSTQTMYMGGIHRRPEDQFVERLIENKEAALKAVNLGDLTKRDFVLRIHMPLIPSDNGDDRIWRTFRVSGGLKLGVFADKVVRPIMGWTRNFHAHVFTEFRDGSLFGSSNCGSVDIMHLDMVGFGYVPEENWCIAHIMSKVGDRVGWQYDFGDRWYHEITLLEICNVEDSTGAATVLTGSGACPRENGDGNYNWQSEIETIKKGTPQEREEVINEMITSVNYKERGWTSRKAFDIDKFDVADAQAAVRRAIDSNSSVAHGAKSFITPMVPGNLDFLYPLQKKESLQRTYDPDSPFGYYQEVMSDRRDKVKKTACANCGSPHELRLCTGCKQRYYCSVQCQRTHWKTKHKAECKHLK